MLMLLPTVLYILLFIHVHSNTTSNASTSTHFQDPCSQMHAPTLLVPTDCLKSQSFFFSFQTSSPLALYYFSFFFATLPYYLLDLFLSLYSFPFFPVQYFIVSSIQTAKVNIALDFELSINHSTFFGNIEHFRMERVQGVHLGLAHL